MIIDNPGKEYKCGNLEGHFPFNIYMVSWDSWKFGCTCFYNYSTI